MSANEHGIDLADLQEGEQNKAFSDELTESDSDWAASKRDMLQMMQQCKGNHLSIPASQTDLHQTLPYCLDHPVSLETLDPWRLGASAQWPVCLQPGIKAQTQGSYLRVMLYALHASTRVVFVFAA